MWIKFNPNPCGRTQVGDCVVRAICAALDVDWDTAFWMAAYSANRMCDMPSGNAVLSAILRQNGFNRAAIENECADCYTAEDFCIDHPYGIYVLGFGDHVCTVIDGNILDTFDSSQDIPQYYFYKRGEV